MKEVAEKEAGKRRGQAGDSECRAAEAARRQAPGGARQEAASRLLQQCQQQRGTITKGVRNCVTGNQTVLERQPSNRERRTVT